MSKLHYSSESEDEEPEIKIQGLENNCPSEDEYPGYPEGVGNILNDDVSDDSEDLDIDDDTDDTNDSDYESLEYLSESDKEERDENRQEKFRKELAKVLYVAKANESAVNKLLKLLREYGHPELPTTRAELFKVLF